MDGPRGIITTGYGIRSTATGEDIEAGVLGAISIHATDVDLLPVLSQLLTRARQELLPF